MYARLKGVLVTGASSSSSAALRPTATPIRWPAGDDGTIRVDVVDDAGATHDVTGETYVLTVRSGPRSETPSLRVVGTPDPGGWIAFAVAGNLTAGLEVGDYRYDVQRTGTGQRAQVVPAAQFTITEAVGRPSDEPAPP